MKHKARNLSTAEKVRAYEERQRQAAARRRIHHTRPDVELQPGWHVSVADGWPLLTVVMPHDRGCWSVFLTPAEAEAIASRLLLEAARAQDAGRDSIAEMDNPQPFWGLRLVDGLNLCLAAGPTMIITGLSVTAARALAGDIYEATVRAFPEYRSTARPRVPEQVAYRPDEPAAAPPALYPRDEPSARTHAVVCGPIE